MSVTERELLRRVVWSLAARRDLQGIHNYIAVMAPMSAQRFTARLVSAVESLAENPDRGRPVGRLRELVIVSPYVVRYSVRAEIIEVMRIKHAAQRSR
jgi:plasmid stabilization system protein ParE